MGKRLDKRAKTNFKTCDVTDWETNNYNADIVQYLKSKSNKTIEFGQLIEYNTRNISLEKSYKKFYREASPRPFFKTPKLSISLDQQS